MAAPAAAMEHHGNLLGRTACIFMDVGPPESQRDTSGGRDCVVSPKVAQSPRRISVAQPSIELEHKSELLDDTVAIHNPTILELANLPASGRQTVWSQHESHGIDLKDRGRSILIFGQ